MTKAFRPARAPSVAAPSRTKSNTGSITGRVTTGILVRAGASPALFLKADGARTPLIALLPKSAMGLREGERVRAQILPSLRTPRPRLTAKVTAVLEHSPDAAWPGFVERNGAHWRFIAYDERLSERALIAGGQRLAEGDVVLARPAGAAAALIERLGAIQAPGIEVLLAAHHFHLPQHFAAAALREAAHASAPTEHAEPARLRQARRDLRTLPLVTIDGADARDFDDAVFAERTEQGWRLLVAIADVSRYVTAGSALDIAAAERGTSVYFPSGVLPMLPEKLSNGLCSLVPGEPRLSLTCEMQLTRSGTISRFRFYPALICSAARLTYEEAESGAPQRPSAVRANLAALHEMGAALLSARRQRGAVDLEMPEVKLVLDAQGQVARIERRSRLMAHRLIEEAMLAANHCAARFLQESAAPALFRAHAAPDAQKLAGLTQALQALGVKGSWGAGAKDKAHGQAHSNISSSEYQSLAEATRAHPAAESIHTLLLRSMPQAIYTPDEAGHFGLAYDAYLHFTSPIRRYPDLLVHRALYAALKLEDAPSLPEGWAAMGEQCSYTERRAEAAERDAVQFLKCRYMQQHLGLIANARITALAAFGAFVMLEEPFVEGMVPVSELGEEFFRFDEEHQRLQGARSGRVLKLGDTIRVQVARVDLHTRRIDLRLV